MKWLYIILVEQTDYIHTFSHRLVGTEETFSCCELETNYKTQDKVSPNVVPRRDVYHTNQN